MKKQQKEQQYKHRKISVRMTLYCILFAVALSGMIGGIGFYTYYTRSIGHFENYMNTLLSITLDGIEEEALRESIRSGQSNEHFARLQSRLNSVKQNSDLQYIYIVYRQEEAYYYVMCGYSLEELETGDDVVQLGDPVMESDIGPNLRRQFDAALEGTLETPYIPNTSDYGYVMTGIRPLLAEGGEAAILGVEIPMEQIKKDLIRYVAGVLAGTVLAVLIFSVFFIVVIRHKIVRPILALGSHADAFVRQMKEGGSDRSFGELTLTTGDELERLAGQMNHMMRALITYMDNLESVTAVQERLNVQMSLASRIQQDILPSTFPAFPERPEFDIYAVMQPAGEVGGDFYDFFMTDGTHLGVVVADVSGEGIPAALFMMMARTLIKNYARLGLEPGKVLYEVNRELCRNNREEMTVEAFVGLLDVYYGDFRYAVAGENTPLIRRVTGEWKEWETVPGFRLGMLEQVSFMQGRCQLEEGEILVLHTAGITGGGFPLKDNLSASKDIHTSGLKELLDQTVEAARKHLCTAGVEADITLLASELKRTTRKMIEG